MGFVRNYLFNLASLAARRAPRRPLLFSYCATHRCGLKCRYCSDGRGAPFRETEVAELSTAGAKRLVAIMSQAADTLDVTGGEPLLRPDLEEILAHAREAKMRTVLNTKGIGLESRPGLLPVTDVLVLSLDSLDPACLAELVGGSRDTAVAVLDAARYAMSTTPRTGTRLVLSAVAIPGHLQETAKVMQFAIGHRLGFQVSPQIVGTRAHPRLRNSEEYTRLMAAAADAKRAGRGILGVREYLAGVRTFGAFRCYPQLMPTARPDGNLYYPCLESGRAEVSLLDAGSYDVAVEAARERCVTAPACKDSCHIFCHMALSLLQTHPLSALGELRQWVN